MVEHWRGIAADYDRSFGRLCLGAVDPLLAELGTPEPGAALLDAGTGSGGVAAAAAPLGWRVVAVDAEPDMVAFTAARLPAVETRTASMAGLPFDDAAFDAIAANFSINHADHPDRVLAELRRVAAPGARIAATVWPWQPTEMNRLWSAIMDATGTRPERIRLPAGEPFPRTEAGLCELLEHGGFRAATARRLDWEFVVTPDDLWAGIAAGLATVGQAHAETDAAGRAAIRAEYVARTTALIGSDGLLRFPAQAILASAGA